MDPGGQRVGLGELDQVRRVRIGPDGRNFQRAEDSRAPAGRAATCQAESITSEKRVPLSPIDRLLPRPLARIAGGSSTTIWRIN